MMQTNNFFSVLFVGTPLHCSPLSGYYYLGRQCSLWKYLGEWNSHTFCLDNTNACTSNSVGLSHWHCVLYRL